MEGQPAMAYGCPSVVGVMDSNHLDQVRFLIFAMPASGPPLVGTICAGHTRFYPWIQWPCGWPGR